MTIPSDPAFPTPPDTIGGLSIREHFASLNMAAQYAAGRTPLEYKREMALLAVQSADALIEILNATAPKVEEPKAKPSPLDLDGETIIQTMGRFGVRVVEVPHSDASASWDVRIGEIEINCPSYQSASTLARDIAAAIRHHAI